MIVIGALDREAPNARTLSEGPLTRYKPNHFLKAPNGFHGVGLGAEHLASLGEAVEEDANFLEPLGGKGSASPEAAFASRKLIIEVSNHITVSVRILSHRKNSGDTQKPENNSSGFRTCQEGIGVCCDSG